MAISHRHTKYLAGMQTLFSVNIIIATTHTNLFLSKRLSIQLIISNYMISVCHHKSISVNYMFATLDTLCYWDIIIYLYNMIFQRASGFCQSVAYEALVITVHQIGLIKTNSECTRGFNNNKRLPNTTTKLE